MGYTQTTVHLVTFKTCSLLGACENSLWLKVPQSKYDPPIPPSCAVRLPVTHWRSVSCAPLSLTSDASVPMVVPPFCELCCNNIVKLHLRMYSDISLIGMVHAINIKSCYI